MNSTIIRKKKVCSSCNKLDYIFSKGRCQSCSNIEGTAKRIEKYAESMIKAENLSDLIAVADSIFSQYIRLKGADENGMVACYTCDTVKHWTLQQCGHYVSRSFIFLRFDERNSKCQCIGCNEFKNGNLAKYTERLEREFPGLPDILKAEATLVHKVSREELNRVIVEYRGKVNDLKKMLK